MKESFGAFIDALELNRDKCPWVSEQTIEQHAEELLSEVHEVAQAIKHKDYDNLREELGDVLMDALFLCVIAQREGHFTIKEVMDDARNKLVRRKPWVFGDEVISTKEEAMKRWNELKALEKQEQQ